LRVEEPPESARCSTGRLFVPPPSVQALDLPILFRLDLLLLLHCRPGFLALIGQPQAGPRHMNPRFAVLKRAGHF
jgi:hypothetical protein